MTLAVLGGNHAFSPAHTGELGPTTVPILKTSQFSVLVLGLLVLTAALLIPVSGDWEVQFSDYWSWITLP